MVIFFTLPPSTIDYPYILINANNPMVGIRYIMTHRKSVEMVIIDSGIEIFRNPNIKEYPGGPESWIRRLVNLYHRVKSIVPHANVYVTAPDYCDDYHHRALWIDENITNIERTIFNILKCVDWYNDVSWLIPIQGWNRKPRSLLWSLEYLHELGVLQRYSYIAVANLCVETNLRVLRDSVLYVYHWLKDHGYHSHRVHIFGLKIASLESVERYIHSFDSMAWTRPVSTRIYRVMNWSAKSEEEKVLFFCEYLVRLSRHSVVLPMEVFKQCLDQLPRIKKVLIARYRNRAKEIEKLVDEITKDVERLVT